MTLILDADAGVLVQGITGRYGGFRAKQMMAYGTQIVGGVTPGRGGEWFEGKPVFDTVQIAVEATGATVSVIAVPPDAAADAIFEAVDASLRMIVCVTTGIPLRDAVRALAYARQHDATVIGPGGFGVCIPGVVNIGAFPGRMAHVGSVGVVARSTTLAYSICYQMGVQGLGQSMIVGIGAGPVMGLSFVDVLRRFESDVNTRQIVLIGALGGTAELRAANFIRSHGTKPVVAYIAGRHATTQQRYSQAGLIATQDDETATAKIQALQAAGVRVAETPEAVTDWLAGG